MWRWAVAAIMAICLLLLVLLVRHRRYRRRTLASLASNRADWLRDHPLTIVADPDETLAAEFAREGIVRIDRFLSPQCLQSLRGEAEASIDQMTPSFIPTHKKGRTLSYEKIHHYAPGCLSFYHSPEIQQRIAGLVGMPVFPTPDGDQSSLSILCYKEKGDHINWHYDHNFYRGRHFTVLLSLANEAASGGLSQSTLMRRLPDGTDQALDTSANTLVVFEGARVLHRAYPTAEGDLRIMLSMTYCADPRTSWLKEFARRIKDTAFYGIRALWD
ncbi:MAG: 2OG-Fe(II) oxygenase [Planctomycetes bacterium]|nr:2OG-Fe(II) oxygenase [Planctomycetota bacterium]